MVKFLKPGRVVLILSGRFAGKKAVVVRAYDEGTKDRPFGHCLVVGIEKPPLRISKKMPEKRQQRKTRVKPFVKYVNYTHIMPTRYVLSNELDFKNVVTDERMSKVDTRKELRKELRNTLTEKYTHQTVSKKGGDKGGPNNLKFFFAKLKF
jgi:large subunit ribosomal protein L27e